MKARYIILLVLVVTVTLLGATIPCRAAEGGERPSREFQRREMTDEMVERMLEQIAERNPEKAKELKELRKKDPDKFQVEFRNAMREFRERFREQRGPRADQQGRFERRGMPAARGGEHGGLGGGRRGRTSGPVGPGGPGEERGGQRGMRMRERMREREAEHLEWLEKNFPEEAKKLAALKEENPELYRKQMAISLKKYGGIKEAEKENPELAKVLKEDLALKGKRNRLVRQIRTSKDDEQKEKLTEELEEIISDRFDLIVRRKQIAYEQLLKKLEKLKKEVKKSEAAIEKWKNADLKNEKVKARLEELVSGSGKFRWE